MRQEYTLTDVNDNKKDESIKLEIQLDYFIT